MNQVTNLKSLCFTWKKITNLLGVSQVFDPHIAGHTIKPRTPEHVTTEHGTPAERRNNAGTSKHHRNTGTRNTR